MPVSVLLPAGNPDPLSAVLPIITHRVRTAIQTWHPYDNPGLPAAERFPAAVFMVHSSILNALKEINCFFRTERQQVRFLPELEKWQEDFQMLVTTGRLVEPDLHLFRMPDKGPATKGDMLTGSLFSVSELPGNNPHAPVHYIVLDLGQYEYLRCYLARDVTRPNGAFEFVAKKVDVLYDGLIMAPFVQPTPSENSVAPSDEFVVRSKNPDELSA